MSELLGAPTTTLVQARFGFADDCAKFQSLARNGLATPLPSQSALQSLINRCDSGAQNNERRHPRVRIVTEAPAINQSFAKPVTPYKC